MKKACFIAFFTIITLFCRAQSVPQGMKFQAAARDLSGNTMANQSVFLQISLISTKFGEKRVHYCENQTAKTNDLGLFDLTIGAGKKVEGSFANVPWSSEEIWTEFKLDVSGKGDYKTISTSRLLTVPYAFHAGSAGEISDGSFVGPLPEACATGSATGTLWSTSSNCASSATAKLGTADYKPLRMVTNGVERVKIEADGKTAFREEVTMDKNLFVAETGVLKRVVVNGIQGNSEEARTYPIEIKAPNLGMSMKLNGNADGDAVFLGFFDDNGMKGSISGQTADELYSGPEFILQTTSYALQVIAVAADAAGLAVEVAGLIVAVVTIPAAVGVSSQIVGVLATATDLAAEIIAYNILQAETVDGIVLNSGGADYAEWLERANPADNFAFGQIVGVKGGKIGFETKNADHVLVISKAPVVLGNLPPENRQKDFEKVAFMGQVPVRVIGGARVGDFILASGHADGYAIAVSPEKMKIEDYSRIVGVAWEASNNSFTSTINVAIGINNNDIADKVAAQNREINQMKAQIAELYAFVKGEIKVIGDVNVEKPAVVAPQIAASLPLLDANTLKFNMEELEKFRPEMEANTQMMIAQMKRQGVNFDLFSPEAKAILADPIQAFKDVQSGKYGQTITEEFRKAKRSK